MAKFRDPTLEKGEGGKSIQTVKFKLLHVNTYGGIESARYGGPPELDYNRKINFERRCKVRIEPAEKIMKFKGNPGKKPWPNVSSRFTCN